MSVTNDGEAVPTGFRIAGYALGFGLGGFFDGILLHQLLQWHHLLSGLEGGRFGDLRFQILADGVFHLVMYLVTLVGLFLLWRHQAAGARSGAARIMLAAGLIGFGAWHMTDAILSHWLLGIHRIRMDSDVPLVWDILWFVVFGVAFVAAGLAIRGGGGPGFGRTGTGALTAITLLAGGLAAMPPSDTSAKVVVFRPGTSPTDAFNAVIRADGRLIWSDAPGQVWLVDLSEGSSRAALYRHGALLVSGAFVSAGCLDWIRRGRI